MSAFVFGGDDTFCVVVDEAVARIPAAARHGDTCICTLPYAGGAEDTKISRTERVG